MKYSHTIDPSPIYKTQCKYHISHYRVTLRRIDLTSATDSKTERLDILLKRLPELPRYDLEGSLIL